MEKVKPTKLEVQLKKALLRIVALENISRERARIIEQLELEKEDLQDLYAASQCEKEMLEDELNALRTGRTL